MWRGYRLWPALHEARGENLPVDKADREPPAPKVAILSSCASRGGNSQYAACHDTPAMAKIGCEPDFLHATHELPLCVDLDRTLVKIDTLQEAAFTACLADWHTVFRLPLWLSRGRAFLKRELAARWQFDPANLPYNQTLLRHLKEERAKGRRIVLVTAADLGVAQKISDFLGIFDEVIASDGVRNLRGRAKATALRERLGAKKFIYAGNDGTDQEIWRDAADGIVVNGSRSAKHAAHKGHNVIQYIDERSHRLFLALAKAARPYQWAKNLLVFVPLVASADLGDVAAWRLTVYAFIALSLVASGIYLLNDMTDLAADRAHPRKSMRPFASGILRIGDGLAAVPALVLSGLFFGYASGALLAVTAYLGLSLAYTTKLKEMPLIDVFALAALYSVRLVAGGEASSHPVSQWLLGFSGFLFLSLALIKRVSEARQLTTAGGAQIPRRGYYAEDLMMLQVMGCASSFTSAVILSLYVQSYTAAQIYMKPQALWGIVPLMLFWQCRLWLSAARGYVDDDPIVYSVRDWVSWVVFGCTLILVVIAHVTI